MYLGLKNFPLHGIFVNAYETMKIIVSSHTILIKLYHNNTENLCGNGIYPSIYSCDYLFIPIVHDTHIYL